jgi:hypothetical protein
MSVTSLILKTGRARDDMAPVVVVGHAGQADNQFSSRSNQKYHDVILLGERLMTSKLQLKSKSS